jgi:hypothetical protein
VAEHQCLFGGEEEVRFVGGVLAALGEEGRGMAYGVGDTGQQVDDVARYGPWDVARCGLRRVFR